MKLKINITCLLCTSRNSVPECVMQDAYEHLVGKDKTEYVLNIALYVFNLFNEYGFLTIPLFMCHR